MKDGTSFYLCLQMLPLQLFHWVPEHLSGVCSSHSITRDNGISQFFSLPGLLKSARCHTFPQCLRYLLWKEWQDPGQHHSLLYWFLCFTLTLPPMKGVWTGYRLGLLPQQVSVYPPGQYWESDGQFGALITQLFCPSSLYREAAKAASWDCAV